MKIFHDKWFVLAVINTVIFAVLTFCICCSSLSVYIEGTTSVSVERSL